MTDLTYRVKITHDDKGIGYSAKKAFEAHQRQPFSFIVQARFAEQPTSVSTTLDIIVRDDHFLTNLREIINRSGRMPNNNRETYKIESVELLHDSQAGERLKDLQRLYSALQRQLETQRLENQDLLSRGSQIEVQTVSTPLHGLLA